MKKVSLLIILVFLVISLFGQNTDILKVNGAEYPDFIAQNEYKYPAYTRAKISFKNGDTAIARINYNNFLHVIKYIDENGGILEIANPQDISYLTIGADTIFSDNGYFQWMASSANAKLASVTNFKLLNSAMIGAFGSSSPATNVRGVVVLKTPGTAHNLSPDMVHTISKVTTYYISAGSGTTSRFLPVNKKNLQKLFPQKDVEKFIEENKIRLNKEKDLIDLMVYIGKSK